MTTYVLVHGGGHGGWCWQRVARLLRAAGADVHTPTLTGLGERSHLVHAGIDLDTHITDVVNVLGYEDLHDVVLAGHSYGGMVVTGVADRAADRVAHLVYLDAAIPSAGQSLADVAPGLMAEARRDARVVDGCELVLWPDSPSVRHYGVTDPDDVAWMRGKLTPHPYRCFSQPLALGDEAAVRAIPRTVVWTHPARADTAAGDVVVETGHDLMITEPAAVADLLLAIRP